MNLANKTWMESSCTRTGHLYVDEILSIQGYRCASCHATFTSINKLDKVLCEFRGHTLAEVWRAPYERNLNVFQVCIKCLTKF